MLYCSTRSDDIKTSSPDPSLPLSGVGGRHTFFLFICVTLLSFVFSAEFTRAEGCSVSTQSASTTNPDIQLDVTCPETPFFKLSESPDFQESADAGVVVSIDNIDPMGEYADVSIRYPNGMPGGNAIPFSVTETTREVRVLAVLFNFDDGSLTPPSYATPGWVERLMFGGDHDGRGLANSINAHVEQNTYGKVRVSGEVYPTWVNISSIEKYRDLNLDPRADLQFRDDIVRSLLESDPGFFDGKEFDFLIALTPGGLRATTIRNYQLFSNWSDSYGLFKGCAMFDIPIDSNSQIYESINNEQRVSTTESIVVPRYNPSSVEGVWLASDTAHTGTNYYTGGRVRYDQANPNYYAHFIELGTPLPAPGSEVVISYKPSVGSRLTDAQMANAPADTLPGTTSFGFMMHELYHGMGWLLTPKAEAIGDLYHTPQYLIENYGLMSTGPYNKLMVGDTRFYVPANLSAYSKVNLDIVQPFTLQYNENELSVRLYKSGEGDFANTNSKIKAIKIPLHPESDIGFQSLVGHPQEEVSFGGEEYLLLEWRHTGELENGAYNFDEALPYGGLVIYRVIEGNPDRHGDSQNMVRIVNATPALFPFDSLATFRSEEVFSFENSAAPFGYDAAVYEYVADAAWNWKAADATSADFLLSPGSGTKTVYAKFMDLSGQVVAESTTTIDLDEQQNQLPVADAGADQTLVDDGDGLEWVALDGGNSYDPDGTLTHYAWYASGTLLAEGIAPTVSLGVGTHIITLEVYDDQGASSSAEVTVTILQAANLAPVADAGPDIVVTDSDMDNVEQILLDGTASYHPDGIISQYNWYKGATLIAQGVAPALNLAVGRHDITLTVVDDSGQEGTDSVAVEIAAGVLPAPTGLTASVTGTDVTLTWSDNGAEETGFYIERGVKAKGKLVFSRVASIGADVTTYTDNLSADTYYFRVQAYGPDAVSEYSQQAQARIKR